MNSQNIARHVPTEAGGPALQGIRVLDLGTVYAAPISAMLLADYETDVGFRSGPAIYSCGTCGQREAVSWRIIPSRVVEDVEVVEEPHVILGDH